MCLKMERINSLQGLRAIAFLGIFLGHCGILGLSGMGVSVFLVLSGFLMIYNYYPKAEMLCGPIHNIRFSLGKIKKLYPLHVLMILPMLFLTIYGVMKTENGMDVESFKEVLLALLANILLVQAWFPIRDIYFGFNGVAWYLSVSLFLYFIFPYILKYMKKQWTRKKAFLVILCMAIIQILLAMAAETLLGKQSIGNTAWFTYIFPVYRSGDFFIGCNLGYLFLTRGFTNKKIVKSTILEIVAIVMLLCTYLFLKTDNIPLGIEQAVIYVPGVSLLIYVLAKQEGFLSKVMGNKLLVEIGNISMYTFLIHQVVINYVEIIGFYDATMPAVAVLITFILAYGYKNLEVYKYGSE